MPGRSMPSRRSKLASLLLGLVAVAMVLGTVACVRTPAPTPRSHDPSQGDPAADGGAGRPVARATLDGRLAITVGDHVVRLSAWPESKVPDELLLRAEDGKALASSPLRRSEDAWEARFLDDEGEPVPLAPGLRLWSAFAGERRELVRLPDLRWAFDRRAKRIRLLTKADDSTAIGDLVVSLSGPGGAESRALPASGGPPSFDWDPMSLAPTAALTLHLRSADGLLAAAWPRRAPYLRVSLLPGDIMGNLEPGAAIQLSLDREGRTGSGIALAGGDGSFTAWIFDAQGRRMVPRQGDLVRAGDGATTLEITVPAFSASWDLEGNRLAGSGPAQAALDFTLWNPWRLGETETPSGLVDAGGTWSLRPRHGLHPATHFYITTHLPMGDQLYYCQQIPMLYLEPGDGSGPSRAAGVEVQALWGLEARVALLRDGREVATAAGGGAWSGNLRLELRDGEGRAVALRPGDRVSLTAEGRTMVAEVGAFDAAFRGGPAQTLEGIAPPGADVALALPESPFAEPAVTASGQGAWRLGTADRWELLRPEPLPGGFPALVGGARVEAFTTLASGHNLRRRFGGPQVEADLGAADFRAVLPEGVDPSSLRLQRGGKPVPLRLEAGGHAWGREYRVTIGDANAAQASLRSGDQLLLQLPGQPLLWSQTVAALQAELAGSLVLGSAEALSLLDVEVTLAEGEPPLRYAVTADEEGSFSLDLARPPAGQALAPLSSVRQVHLVRQQDGLTLRLPLGRPQAPEAAPAP